MGFENLFLEQVNVANFFALVNYKLIRERTVKCEQ